MLNVTCIAKHSLACRFVLVAVASAALVSSAMAQSAALFPEPVTIPLPNTTTSSSVTGVQQVDAPEFVDMNGDGALDVIYETAVGTEIVSNGGLTLVSTPTIHVMLHNGTATANVTLASATCTGPLAVYDFNGDGKQDVAMSCGGKLYILLGNGDGTLQQPITTTVPANTTVFDFYDVNKDGLPDLITAGTVNGAGFIDVQLNNGHSLGAPTTYPILGRVSRIRSGDVNGDGNLDLVVTGSHLTILYGKGDGTFQPPVSLAETGLSSCVVVSDLNGDGIDDIATCSTIHQDAFDVLFGGSGTPAIARSYPLPVGSGPVLSSNGQGGGTLRASRLVTGGARALFYGSYNLSMFLNDGAGNFSAPVSFAGYGNGNVAFADWNGDGKDDALAVANSGPEMLFVSEGDGTGKFQGLPPASFPPQYTGGYFVAYPSSAPYASLTVAADFNGDGLLDFATLGANGITVSLSNGDGTTTPVTSASPTVSSQIVEGDLNNDGKADVLVVTASGTGDIILTSCLGNGTGALTCGTPQDIGTSNVDPAIGALADFAGNGIPDLIFGVAPSGPGNEQYYFLRGLGNGNFAAPVLETMPLTNSVFYQGFFAIDINHDGKADIIPAEPSVALLSNGDGTFIQGGEFAVNAQQILAVADVTGDGNPDVIALTGTLTTPGIVIYPGTASGAFPDAPIVVDVPSNLFLDDAVVTVGDLAGNGLTDIAVLSDYLYPEGNGGLGGGGLELVPILNHSNTSFVMDPAGPYVVPWADGSYGPVFVGKLNRSGTVASDVAYSTGAAIAVLLNTKNAAPPVMTSTVTVASVSSNPVVSGQTVTLRASVSAADDSLPTGTVSMLVNGNAVASATLSAGAASLSASTAGVAEGNYAFSIRYNGDATHKSSTSGVETVSVTGATAPTTTALNISFSGQLTQNVPVVVQAGVYAVGGGNPSGTVSFYADGQLIGTASVVNNYAELRFNTGAVPGGAYTVQAVYSGDSSFAGSHSDVLKDTLHNTTATTVALSPTSGGPGASVTVTAHVSRPLTSGVPAGSVVFSYGSNGTLLYIGSASLDNNGNATFTADVPGDAAPGTYTVQAQYDGSANSYDYPSQGTAPFVVPAP